MNKRRSVLFYGLLFLGMASIFARYIVLEKWRCFGLNIRTILQAPFGQVAVMSLNVLITLIVLIAAMGLMCAATEEK